jgi:acyl carrier protein
LIDKNDVKKLLLTIIKDDDITIETIQDNTELIGENGIFYDSVDVLELLVELENKFGIKVKDNDIVQKKLKTFNTLYQFIIENSK